MVREGNCFVGGMTYGHKENSICILHKLKACHASVPEVDHVIYLKLILLKETSSGDDAPVDFTQIQRQHICFLMLYQFSIGTHPDSTNVIQKHRLQKIESKVFSIDSQYMFWTSKSSDDCSTVYSWTSRSVIEGLQASYWTSRSMIGSPTTYRWTSRSVISCLNLYVRVS